MVNIAYRLKAMTLFECMLALSLGSLLMLTLTAVYGIATQTLQAQSTLYDRAMRLEAVSYVLYDDISHAGFVGCAHLPASAQSDYVMSDGQRFTVRYIEHLTGLSTAMRKKTFVNIAHDSDIKTGDTVMISDCVRAQSFKVKSIRSLSTYDQLTPDKPLLFLYGEQSTVGTLISHQYFLQNTDSGYSSLYFNNGILSYEIVPNVQSLQWKIQRRGIAVTFSLDSIIFNRFIPLRRFAP